MTFYNLVKENIITFLNLQDLDEDKKVDLIEDIVNLLEKRLIIRIVNFLEEEDINKLVELLSKDSENQVLDFLKEKIPNIEEMLWEEVNKFKLESKNLLSN